MIPLAEEFERIAEFYEKRALEKDAPDEEYYACLIRAEAYVDAAQRLRKWVARAH